MTAEQLELAKELDREIRRIKGVINVLAEATSTLRVREREYDCKYISVRIEFGGCEYKQIPLDVLNFIYFLEEQKTKYEEEVNELNEEFSEL